MIVQNYSSCRRKVAVNHRTHFTQRSIAPLRKQSSNKKMLCYTTAADILCIPPVSDIVMSVYTAFVSACNYKNPQ